MSLWGTGIDILRLHCLDSTILASMEDALDWVLTNYDEEKSAPQSVEEELRRLQVLRSYLVLDSEREFPFERLTALAGRIMNVPIALVSLVDLGRQWFMSNRGLGDVRETPRSQAFCAHAILSKDDLLIINDATKDGRFAENPLVTGPPHIRFYAGAPLLAPEGYKLGTFCIIDSKPRENGLDFESKQNLQEFSAMAVQVLVARRRRRERAVINNSQQVACAAHDLLTPLSGLELSLSLLREDADLQSKLSQSHKDALARASTCSVVLQQICSNVRSTFGEMKSSFELSFIQAQLETFRIDDLVHKLYSVIEPIPKRVPVKITIDPNVPKEIISDSAKILRCAINYLAVACARTMEGCITMRIFSQNLDGTDFLFVECEDTAPPVNLDMYKFLFKPVRDGFTLLPEELVEGMTGVYNKDQPFFLELALFSVACQMNVVGGEFGFRPRNSTNPRNYDDDTISEDTSCLPAKEATEYTPKVEPTRNDDDMGSIFWFQIYYRQSNENGSAHRTSGDTAMADGEHGNNESSNEKPITHLDASNFHQSITTMMSGSSEKAITKKTVVERKKRALVIEDSTVVRKMLSKLLTKVGFEVSEAENGLEGLEELKSSLYDLTLCDFLMPALDGLDCVQQYRDWENIHRPWFKQWIIGISAHASDADVEKGRRAGMNGFKPKPITFRTIKGLLEEDDQIAASKRLDELEGGVTMPTISSTTRDDTSSSAKTAGDTGTGTGDQQSTSTQGGGLRNTKRMKVSVTAPTDEQVSIKACLLLTPNLSTSARVIQQTLLGLEWLSTVGMNDGEAWTLLRMRTWDLVLVDETFAQILTKFRTWETSARITRQNNVVLMSDSITTTLNGVEEGKDGQKGSDTAIQPPNGADGVIGKPITPASLSKLIGGL